MQNTYDKEVQNGKIAKRFYWWGWGGRQGAFEVFSRIEGNCPVHHCPWHCVVAKSRQMRLSWESRCHQCHQCHCLALSVTGAFTRHFWAWPSSSLSAPWRPVMPVMPVNDFLTSEVKLWKSNEFEHLYFWFEHLNWSHTKLISPRYQLCDDESKYRWFIQQHFSLLHSLGCKANSRGFITMPYFSTTNFYLNRLFIIFLFPVFFPFLSTFHVTVAPRRSPPSARSGRPGSGMRIWRCLKWSEVKQEAKRRNEETKKKTIPTFQPWI